MSILDPQQGTGVPPAVQAELDKKLPSDAGGALLSSPDGQSWRVTVGNDGALVATAITPT